MVVALSSLIAAYSSAGLARYLQSDPIGLQDGHATESQADRVGTVQPSLNLYAYAENNPARYIDPMGLYVCVYSIANHSMVCSPTNPANPPFSSSDFVSGNNTDPKCSDCQDNPNRTNVSDHGPIPVGSYTIAGLAKGRRNLTPNPANGRFSFQLHACPNRATCSAGCVASPGDWQNLNKLLSTEEGWNVLTVTP